MPSASRRIAVSEPEHLREVEDGYIERRAERRIHLSLAQIEVLLAEGAGNGNAVGPRVDGHGEHFRGRRRTISLFGTPKAAPQHSSLKAKSTTSTPAAAKYPVHRHGVLRVVEAGELWRPVEYASVVGGNPQVPGGRW